jgi:phospholipase C
VALSFDGDINAVNHIIIMMQENRSFDNYFGSLPYVSGGPYHPGPVAVTITRASTD